MESVPENPTHFRASASVGRRISTFFYMHPTLTLILMLLPIILWLGVVYFGSIGALLVQSFFHLDGFTGLIVKEFGWETWNELVSCADQPFYNCPNFDIIERTFYMASAVTIACAILAFPLAYYMARYGTFRTKGVLYLLVLLPLWSSYLVRVYAWKLILAKEGVVTWSIDQLGLSSVLEWLLERPIIGGPSLSFSYMGMFFVFVYVWLPYMILPINAAVERVPKSLLEASSDLGARPGYTFWRVILPLVFPGVVAGSIFTFSLTLGDYIIPSIIGNSSFFIGSAVLIHQGTAGNIPLAAAFTAVPIAIMAVYLTIAKRLGAFDAL